MIPVLLIAVAWPGLKYYRPKLLKGAFKFSNKDFMVYGVDASSLRGTYTRAISSQSTRPLVVLVADLNLDRNWDAPAFSFRSGKWLSEALASFGIDSIRYDHRGTGDTVASVKTKHNFLLKAQDLHTVYDYAQEQKTKSLFLVAHGRACALALYTLQKWKLHIDGLILLSCGNEGNILDAWANKLFFNMKRKGVKKSIIAQAKQEWQEYLVALRKLKGGVVSFPTRKQKDEHPDIGAFHVALDFLSSDSLSFLRKEGMNFHLFSAMRKQTLTKKTPILHIVGNYDEERPQQDQAATSRFARKLKQIAKLQGLFYNFIEIENCDYFLKEQDHLAQGLPLVWQRISPFRSLDSSLITAIRDMILVQR